MKKFKKFLLVIFSAALVFCLVHSNANAVSISHLSSDIDLNNTLNSKAFVAEGRIGDLGGNATFELDLGADTSAPFTSANYAWPNSIAVSFLVEYTAATGDVIFSVPGDGSGQTLSYASTPPAPINSIFIRTRAVNSGSSISVDNLTLTDFNGNNMGVGSASSQTSGDTGGLDILQISSLLLDYDWTMSGTSTMSWIGSAPKNSRLAYQIKVGNATLTGGESFPIPEPSSFILLGIGCAGFLLFKKKNS